MKSSSERIRAVVADQAADWFVQNREGPLDREARAEFTAWLKASPLHIEEYLGIAAMARDFTAATDDPDLALESLLDQARPEERNVVALTRPLPINAPVRMVHRSWSFAVAAAAAVAVVFGTAIWTTRDGERFGLPRTYSTEHGEQRVQQLPDGSVLHLNTDSRVTVRYSGGERVVDLLRGQAFFEVAHESRRQFRVAADVAGIVAVGTRFDVYQRPGTVTVTVAEGTVAVYTGIAPGPANQLPERAVRVGAGYQLDVSGRVGEPHRVNAQAILAWMQRQIAFENTALGEVAAEFNRYGRVALQIDDQTVRALPISGVFDAYDTDSFAAFLETLNGVVVQRTQNRIRVTSVASTSREPLSVAR
jgi:transmembrane sensor